MFPPEVYGVGVTVERLLPAPWEEEVVLPAGVVSRPSRLGELLTVNEMTPEQKALQLQRVQQVESVLAAYKAELVVGLGEDRPATVDRRRGQVGSASEQWADDVLDEDVSEFYADELAMILNCSRTAATLQWEQSTTLRRRLPAPRAAAGDGRGGGAGRRCRTAGWSGRGPGPSPPNWAGPRGRPPTTWWPRSSRRCCPGPASCRSAGCRRWSARN